MAKKAVINDVARTRKEMVERLRRQEMEARRSTRGGTAGTCFINRYFSEDQ